MGAEIDGDRAALFVKQGQKGPPQGPRNVLVGMGRVQKGYDRSDAVLSHETTAYKGLNATGLVVGMERFATVELVKVRGPGTFPLQNGLHDGRQTRLGP